ncbi:enoyl-CoA hydratase/isomerase family protein [Pararhodobacter marinus]|uniref:enoyl-CoA hydratase/isomerase family protein n=1 Tax=Pararhodobacter marinus TaxID=2184063 RepID=UPI00351196B5
MDYSRYKNLKVERDGAILRITIDRAEKRNALDHATQLELGRIFYDVANDAEARAVVLTGAGDKFSVGGDLPKMQTKIDDPTLYFDGIPNAKHIVNGILDCPKPIIARINGDCVGLGCTIAVMCDFTVVVDDAKIGDPHVKAGLVAGDGGSVIWPQLVGFARARRYLLTGDLLSGAEAAQIGLLTSAVPAADLDAEVDKWANRMATGATISIVGTKMTINSVLKQIASTSMDVGMAYEGLANVSADHQEAVTAFVEKRKPVFTGK